MRLDRKIQNDCLNFSGATFKEVVTFEHVYCVGESFRGAVFEKGVNLLLDKNTGLRGDLENADFESACCPFVYIYITGGDEYFRPLLVKSELLVSFFQQAYKSVFKEKSDGDQALYKVIQDAAERPDYKMLTLWGAVRHGVNSNESLKNAFFKEVCDAALLKRHAEQLDGILFEFNQQGEMILKQSCELVAELKSLPAQHEKDPQALVFFVANQVLQDVSQRLAVYGRGADAMSEDFMLSLKFFYVNLSGLIEEPHSLHRNITELRQRPKKSMGKQLAAAEVIVNEISRLEATDDQGDAQVQRQLTILRERHGELHAGYMQCIEEDNALKLCFFNRMDTIKRSLIVNLNRYFSELGGVAECMSQFSLAYPHETPLQVLEKYFPDMFVASQDECVTSGSVSETADGPPKVPDSDDDVAECVGVGVLSPPVTVFFDPARVWKIDSDSDDDLAPPMQRADTDEFVEGAVGSAVSASN